MSQFLEAIPAIRCIFFDEKSKKDAASIRAKLSAKVNARPHKSVLFRQSFILGGKPVSSGKNFRNKVHINNDMK